MSAEQSSSTTINITTMKDIYHFATNANANVDEFLQKYDLPTLFGLLVSQDDNSNIQIALDKIFRSERGVAFLTSEHMQIYLLNGLNHPQEEIRVFSLQQLGYLLKDVKGVQYLLHETIYDQIIQLISDDSTECAEQASALLSALSNSEAGLTVFFSVSTVKQFKQLAQANSNAKLRILTLAADIAIHSSKSFQLYRQSELYNMQRDDLTQEKDLLVQLNIIELFNKFAASPGSLSMFDDNFFLQSLFSLIPTNTETKQESDATSGFIITAGLKVIQQVFASVTQHKYLQNNYIHSQTHPWFGDTSLYQFLLQHLEHTDDTVQATVISTVSSIATSPLGLLSMCDVKVPYEPTSATSTTTLTPDQLIGVDIQSLSRSLLWKIHEYISSTNDLVKIAVVDSLSCILRLHDYSSNINHAQLNHVVAVPYESILQIQQHFFLSIPEKEKERIFHYLQQPFQDSRIATFKLINALSQQKFGLKYLIQRSAFLEFLLNRKTESIKAGAEWKYQIIHTMLQNPLSKQTDVLSLHFLQKLQSYAEQGVFYGRSVAREDPQVKVADLAGS